MSHNPFHAPSHCVPASASEPLELSPPAPPVPHQGAPLHSPRLGLQPHVCAPGPVLRRTPPPSPAPPTPSSPACATPLPTTLSAAASPPAPGHSGTTGPGFSSVTRHSTSVFSSDGCNIQLLPQRPREHLPDGALFPSSRPLQAGVGMRPPPCLLQQKPLCPSSAPPLASLMAFPVLRVASLH